MAVDVVSRGEISFVPSRGVRHLPEIPGEIVVQSRKSVRMKTLL